MLISSPRRTTVIDELNEALIDAMVQGSEKARLKLLQTVDNAHVMLFVTWAMTERVDHEGHGEDCSFHNMKDLTEGYLEQFTMSITKSIQATCEANGISYMPDPNKEVRDEILAEGNS
jgi:hypothetical protein